MISLLSDSSHDPGDVITAPLPLSPPTVLGPVTNLKPMEDLLQINLTWVAPTGPSGAITTYEVSYQLSSSSVGGMKENTTNKAHRVTGLKRGTSYSITVRAFSQAGAGDSTSITTTTLSKPRKSRFTQLLWLRYSSYSNYYPLSVPLFLSSSFHSIPSILFLPLSFCPSTQPLYKEWW